MLFSGINVNVFPFVFLFICIFVYLYIWFSVLYFYIFVCLAGCVARGWYIGTQSYIWTHPTIHQQSYFPFTYLSLKYFSFKNIFHLVWKYLSLKHFWFENIFLWNIFGLNIIFLWNIFGSKISSLNISFTDSVSIHPTIKEDHKRRQIFSFQRKKLSLQNVVH